MDREEFMSIVYDELYSDGDNNRANRIIDAADEYAESARLGTDCISRQVAINVLKRKQYNGNGYISRFYNTIIQHDIEAIEQLPPAQSEIIYCKDCKHHWTHKCMDSMPIERCDLEQTFYDAEHDFCSLAERREVTE